MYFELSLVIEHMITARLLIFHGHNDFLFLLGSLMRTRDLVENPFQCTGWNFACPLSYELCILLFVVSTLFIFFILLKYHLKLYYFLSDSKKVKTFPFTNKMVKKIYGQAPIVLQSLLKGEIFFQTSMELINFRQFSPYTFFTEKKMS